MNDGIKAALLSALVIPGLGQIILKRYLRGAFIMAVVLAILVLLARKIILIALLLLQQVENRLTAPSIAEVAEIAWQALQKSDGPTFSLLIFLLLTCWIYSSVDAYLLGKESSTNH